MVSRGDRNIPTRLAPNCHLHRLPPTLYILLKKRGKYVQQGGLGQNPQRKTTNKSWGNL